MSVAQRLHRYSLDDYLAVEAMSVVKHEFLDGEVYALAGGSARHAALAAAVGAALLLQLRGGRCRVYSSDLRIRVRETGLSTYPDVSVICGPVESDPDSAETAINPTVVVEVLSNSTMDYDLGEKFEHYRKIPTLSAVVYVSQTEPRIEVRERRSGGEWANTIAGPGGAVDIDALKACLVVDDVYRDATPPST